MTTRATRGRAAAALGLVALLGLTGCTPKAPDQSGEPMPKVVWSDGEPSGEFEQDPWVVAARASLTALAVAQNRNDFRLPEFVETSEYDVRSAAWRGARDRLDGGGRTLVNPGPQPLAPQSVQVDGDDSARVSACVALGWATVEGKAPSSFETAGAEYTMARTDDGRIVLRKIAGLPGLDCEDAAPAVGLFDPAPQPSTFSDSGDLVRPEIDPE